MVRLVLAKPHPAPWIFSDEIAYSNLAQSFGESGRFAIRDAAGLHGYGPGYPMLIAPAYALFDDLAHAFAAAKAINAVLMSLAAVPVYLIARRLVSLPLALAAAALAVAIPSFIYTGTMMTENAFYPAFALCILVMLTALERPTLWRQLGALAAVFGTFLIRAQAVTLVLAFATVIALVCLVEARAAGRMTRRDLTRRLLEFRATWIALAAGALLVLAAAVVRGRSPSQVLGGYSGLLDFNYDVGDVARWFLFHVAELDLYLGVLPFAAFVMLVLQSLSRAELPRLLRLFGLLGLSVVVWMSLVVSATASFFVGAGAGRIEERNLFHVVPLFLIALVVWIESRPFRVWPAAAFAALLAGALPGAIPYHEFANLGALSDTLALIPLWNLVFFRHIEPSSLTPLVVFGSLAAAALFLLLPRRALLLAPVLVFAWFLILNVTLEKQIAATSKGVLQQGLTTRREWIDEAVGSNAEVAVLWSGNASPMTVLQNEFFNRSVHSVYALGDVPAAADYPPEHRASIDETTGALRTEGSGPLRAQYALADHSLEVAAPVVARDRGTAIALYRVEGELHLRGRVSGIYPDTWTGSEVTYTRWDCRGGRLLVSVASQPGLFKKPQTVVATVGDRVVGRIRAPATGDARSALLPLLPEGDRCSIRLRVSSTAIPAEILGTPDTRELGVRVTALEYRPS